MRLDIINSRFFKNKAIQNTVLVAKNMHYMNITNSSFEENTNLIENTGNSVVFCDKCNEIKVTESNFTKNQVFTDGGNNFFPLNLNNLYLYYFYFILALSIINTENIEIDDC